MAAKKVPEMKSSKIIDFISDAHFSELKNAEVLRERLGLLNEIDGYVGKFFSKEWIQKNILMQTDEEIEEIKKQIDQETKDNEIREFDPEVDQSFPGGQPAVGQEGEEGEEVPPQDSQVPTTPGEGPEDIEEPDTQPNDKEAKKNEVR